MDPSTIKTEINTATTDFWSLLQRTGLVDETNTEAAADEAVKAAKKIAATTGAITRPNGMVYIPRPLVLSKSTMMDIDVIRAARANEMPMLLFGVPGTGKTAMVEAAFGDDLVTLQGSGETEVADFVGSWTQQPDGTYLWVDGPLVVAMDAGKPFLVDEIALIDPQTMAVVYGVMDGRGELVVTANPGRGVVKAKPGFYVAGACNPDVPGAMMSDALLSRFKLHVRVAMDWKLIDKLSISPVAIAVAKNLHDKVKSGLVSAAPQVRELIAFRDIEAVFGSEMALANMVSQAREQDRAAYVAAIQAASGVFVDTLSVGN